MEPYIIPLSDVRMTDVSLVGGKNASLGELQGALATAGIQVPEGFAITAAAFREFLRFNDLAPHLANLMRWLQRPGYDNLRETGSRARALILDAQLPDDLKQDIITAYRSLCREDKIHVAVRSSATAEDLPDASFAGQHDSFLNIEGERSLLNAVQRCFASLYNDRAIKYREDKGFGHDQVAISVGIQKMVNASEGAAGVCFTLEPETGFRDIIHLSAVWGLGESIVQGMASPDEYYVFKPTLEQGKKAILQRKAGAKEWTMQYAAGGKNIASVPTAPDKRQALVLTETEVYQLCRWALAIERHYGRPMDIEWVRDGAGRMYIVQARPETVHAVAMRPVRGFFHIREKGACLVKGEAIGEKVVSGVARLLQSPAEAASLQDGDIIVADVTSPDWDPLLKRCGGIVTNRGGRTSHAAIVARELGVPAVVGTMNATQNITEGQLITLSCCEGRSGFVYDGRATFDYREISTDHVRKPDGTEVMLIVADPAQAFRLSFYPNDGVGLLRMEFIITHLLRIHPMALVNYTSLPDEKLKQEIAAATSGYADKKNYCIDRLSEGIGTIAAAFYPKDVIVRFSDFKSNEYAGLMGGHLFEQEEENPMIGFRGASRYYDGRYKPAFALECNAIQYVRQEMGLTNIKVMVPFCRTVEEARKVVATMREFGLDREKDPSLEIYMMVEIPSNVLQEETFAEIFDGFSIGGNDLTQLTLGVDRDNAVVAGSFNEQDPAVLQLVKMAIDKARHSGIPIGFCGQAPSDHPGYAKMLAAAGIHSVSFNPDAVFSGMENMAEAEQQLILNTI